MVAFEQVAPRSVTEVCRRLGRPDDVGEEHCREDAFEIRGLIPQGRHEPVDLGQHPNAFSTAPLLLGQDSLDARHYTQTCAARWCGCWLRSTPRTSGPVTADKVPVPGTSRGVASVLALRT